MKIINAPIQAAGIRLDVGASARAIREKSLSEVRTFRKVSNEFFGAEASRDYVSEFLLFTLIAAIAAWPIISTIVGMIHRFSNY